MKNEPDATQPPALSVTPLSTEEEDVLFAEIGTELDGIEQELFEIEDENLTGPEFDARLYEVNWRLRFVSETPEMIDEAKHVTARLNTVWLRISDALATAHRLSAAMWLSRQDAAYHDACDASDER